MNDTELTIKRFAYGLVYYIFWLIEILLAFRFVFKLLGANPRNVFVNFFYSASATLVMPFVDMFRIDPQNTSSVFEPYTIIAMLVYAIITHLILLFIKKFVKTA